MREIKFRGRKSNGEWIYGDLVHNVGVGASTALIFPEEAHDSWDRYIILTDTIGQFTGLHDKNGKEIYEGDVVLSKLKRARKYDEILQICFDDSEYCGKNKNGSSTSLSLLEDYHTVEVIGNIHDNPELLNK